MRVAPTVRSSLMAMATLSDLGVIAVPWPELSWPMPAGAERTPIEGLEWRYCWGAYPRGEILLNLEQHLSALPPRSHVDLRLELWRELSLAEAEAFFQHELRRHRFNPAWSEDLAYVYRDERPALSISQWRYCCWAAVRHAASVAQRQSYPDLQAVRDAAYLELRRRAMRMAAGIWSTCALPPYDLRPDSALARVTANLLPSLGVYWNTPPAMEVLKQHG